VYALYFRWLLPLSLLFFFTSQFLLTLALLSLYPPPMLNDWPKMQGIYLQHFIGGALCLPAVLGYTDSWAANLACLGVLSEMGW